MEPQSSSVCQHLFMLDHKTLQNFAGGTAKKGISVLSGDLCVGKNSLPERTVRARGTQCSFPKNAGIFSEHVNFC